eukprot:TRINITY_DN2718_c0_g1_i8.p4 TRINITY_DN2718_c0_g1~~TRINITY_DN2718_c0_g1_i8.p4  ORF type:complete len:239 (-),score=-33.42 TRINITY_DN2718_c0_g1_i8:740-1360(-)
MKKFNVSKKKKADTLVQCTTTDNMDHNIYLYLYLTIYYTYIHILYLLTPNLQKTYTESLKNYNYNHLLTEHSRHRRCGPLLKTILHFSNQKSQSSPHRTQQTIYIVTNTLLPIPYFKYQYLYVQPKIIVISSPNITDNGNAEQYIYFITNTLLPILYLQPSPRLIKQTFKTYNTTILIYQYFILYRILYFIHQYFKNINTYNQLPV